MNITDPQLQACLAMLDRDEHAQRALRHFPGHNEQFQELRHTVMAAAPVIAGSTFRRAKLASRGCVVTVESLSPDHAYARVTNWWEDAIPVLDLLDPREWTRLS